MKGFCGWLLWGFSMALLCKNNTVIICLMFLIVPELIVELIS